MKRRQFITCFGATLAANTLSWSRAARAQLSAMPSGALPSSAKPDDLANGLDPLLQQAQALGAPMAAVGRAITISHQQTFAKKDALAVFDISQPSANKRFYLLDFKSDGVTAYYAAHGRSNGPNAKAVKFKGFRRDLDMTPLGSLKTAHSEAWPITRPLSTGTTVRFIET
jgi:L,D-transpeptidase catalytic domain